MTTLSRFDVAITLYPFTDMAVARPRPCLVVSADKYRETEGAIIAAMITTAANSRWLSDLPIEDIAGAGLKRPSVIRWKLFTFDLALIGGRVGTLSKADARKAERGLRAALDI